MEAVGGVAQLVLEGPCALGVTGWAGRLPMCCAAAFIAILRLIPVAAPFHPLAALETIGSAAVREHTQLVLSDASRMTDGQDFGVLSLRTWRLGDLGAKHALLIAGLGWGNMPEHLVADDIAAGRLKLLPIEEAPGFDYPISLVQRADTALGRPLPGSRKRFARFGKEGQGSALVSLIGAIVSALRGWRPPAPRCDRQAVSPTVLKSRSARPRSPSVLPRTVAWRSTPDKQGREFSMAHPVWVGIDVSGKQLDAGTYPTQQTTRVAYNRRWHCHAGGLACRARCGRYRHGSHRRP